MMDIRDVSAYGLSAPFDRPREFQFAGGVRRIFKRDAVLVELETADGLHGFAPVGASSSAMREYFQDATPDNLIEVINTIVAPNVQGEPANDIEHVHSVLEEINLPDFLYSQSAAAIDIALFDIMGKRQGEPIYKLLSNRFDRDAEPRTKLPMYASGGMYMPPDGYVQEAKSLEDVGFSAYKYRPGRGIEEDRETFDRLVDAVGDSMDIMVDAHTWWKMGDESYSKADIRMLSREFADEALWIEEPVAPGDLAGYHDLADKTTAHFAGGESAESVADLISLGETGTVEYLQGDVRHHEGFTGCLKAIRHNYDHDITFVPHNFGTHLGLVANAHLVAANPKTPYLEYPAYETEEHDGMYPYPLSTDILSTSLDISDGILALPDEPGIGVEVNRSVIDDYPYIEGPWTEFVYS